MKTLVLVFCLLAVPLSTAFPVTAQAAPGQKAKSEVVMKIGSRVHLFYSSKVSVQKEVAIGDVLQVYRQMGGKDVQPNEVGQVKVLSFIDENYFEAEIVKGEVKVGDIAKKKGASMLVQPARR